MLNKIKKNGRAAIALPLVALFSFAVLSGCKGEDDTPKNNMNSDVQAQQNESGADTSVTPVVISKPENANGQVDARLENQRRYEADRAEKIGRVDERFLLRLDDLPVNRPDGTSFMASAIAYCDLIDQDYDGSDPASLAAYKTECTKITNGTLNYYGCDRNGFLASVSTNNVTLRARSLGIPETDVKEGHLFTEDDLKYIVGDREYNVLTLTGISDIEAGLRREGFTPGQNCAQHFYKPKP